MNNTKQYELEIVYKQSLKHTYISLLYPNVVRVKTSSRSLHYIDTLLQKKRLWIEKGLQKLAKKKHLYEKKMHTLAYIQSRVDYFAREMQLEYTKIRFRKMKRSWGLCRSDGTITLNKALQKIPGGCVDYVVVHELAHLVHMNHSRAFHMLVEKTLPNAREFQAELEAIVLLNH